MLLEERIMTKAKWQKRALEQRVFGLGKFIASNKCLVFILFDLVSATWNSILVLWLFATNKFI